MTAQEVGSLGQYSRPSLHKAQREEPVNRMKRMSLNNVSYPLKWEYREEEDDGEGEEEKEEKETCGKCSAIYGKHPHATI